MIRITTKCICGYYTIREARNNEEDSKKKIISGDKDFINIAPLTEYVPMFDWGKKAHFVACPECGLIYYRDIAVKEEVINS